MASSNKQIRLLLTYAWLPLAVIGVLVLHLKGYSWQEFIANDGPYSVILFILLMTILPGLGVPITPFYLFAGAAYDYPNALLVCGISIFLNMVLSYGVSHTTLAGTIGSILKKQKWINRLMIKDNHLYLTITLRIIPGIPYTFQNYALAIAGVPFFLYITLSMLIQSLYMAAWLYLGNAGAGANIPEVTLALIILLLLIIGTRYICKRLLKPQTSKPCRPDLQ